MFDPHYIRSNHNRRYQKKGQIIQAKKVQIPRTIEQELIPLYQEYFIKNYIPGYISPLLPIPSFYIQNISTKLQAHTGNFSLPQNTSIFIITEEGQNILLNLFSNRTPNQNLNLNFTGYYFIPATGVVPIITPNNEVIFSLRSIYVVDGHPPSSNLQIPSRPDLVLNQIDS